MQIARFFVVAGSGLVLDIAVAWTAKTFLNFPMWLAASLGFGLGAITNYALHELWTFYDPIRRPSVASAVRYGFALGVTLITRIGAVIALTELFGKVRPLVVLIAAAAVSFLVHYSISKHFVFSDCPKLRRTNL